MWQKQSHVPTSELPLRYLDDDIVLSDSEAWVYVRIPNQAYEFLTSDDRVSLLQQMTLAFASLTTTSQVSLDVHMRIVHKPFPYAEWYRTLDERAHRNGCAPGWGDYSKDMLYYVVRSNFQDKRVYFGVKLGDRSSVNAEGQSAGAKDLFGDVLLPLKKFVDMVSGAAGLPNVEVSEKEIDTWVRKARGVRKTLRESYLKAEPVSASELAWVLASPLWPQMPQPEMTFSDATSWGAGELVQVVDSDIVHHRKWLEITQTYLPPDPELPPEDVTGYVAFLAVSRFPDSLAFPGQPPWLYYVESAFAFPVDASIRFSIIPPLQVKKDVGKKLADARDQAQHIAETGAGIPLHIREQVETATALEYVIDKERVPWAYSRPRFIVTAETSDELAAQCKKIMEDYRELGIDIVWPSGDQLNLLIESFPGASTRVKSYEQKQDLAVIPGGMANASSECGDLVVTNQGKPQGWLGPYIGRTVMGSMSPVMLSPHVAIAQNAAPGVSITGSPGGGKALAVDTPILTSQGWSTMGDIQVGDYVYGNDGTPTRVVAVTDVMHGRPCYVVEFRNGERITADADHLWETAVLCHPHLQQLRDGTVPPAEETTTVQRIHDSLPHEPGLPTLVDDTLHCDVSHTQLFTTAELFQQQIFHGQYSEPTWTVHPDRNNGSCPTLNVSPPDGGTPVRYVIPTTAPLLNPGTSSPYTPHEAYRWGTLTRTHLLSHTPHQHCTPGPSPHLWTAVHHLLRNGTPQLRQAYLNGLLNIPPRKDTPTLTPAHTAYSTQGVLPSVCDTLIQPLTEMFASLGYLTQHGTNQDTLHPLIQKVEQGQYTPEPCTMYEYAYPPLSTLHTPPTTVDHPPAPIHRYLAYSYHAPHEIVSITPTRSVPVKCLQVADTHHTYLAGFHLIPTHNSFLAFTLTYAMAMQGVWTIYIDPKADAKPMETLTGLGKVRVFDLRHGNDGMLDPFSIGTNLAQAKLLALETFRLLLGKFSEEREEVLSQKIAQVAQEPHPSLSRIVDLLLEDPSPAAHNLGVTLDLIRDLEFSRLCFARTQGIALRPEEGLTIVTLLGLELPGVTVDPSDYSYDNKLAVAVMYLLTRYARKLMLSLDKNHPKAICIDEAWAITSTPQGARLIPEIARMGRSHNTALVLVSQNASDLMAQSVTNNISTKFAFRAQDTEEIHDVLAYMGISEQEGYGRAIRELNNGECLMQDVHRRVALMRVDNWNEELFTAFNTNPETRKSH